MSLLAIARAKLPPATELRQRALELKLQHAERLDRYTDQELARVYNGVGPDRWSDKVRKLLSKVLLPALPAVLVHDVDYDIGGDYHDFLVANRTLADNVNRIAGTYPWYSRTRRRLRRLAPLMEAATTAFGWAGFHRTTA